MSETMKMMIQTRGCHRWAATDEIPIAENAAT